MAEGQPGRAMNQWSEIRRKHGPESEGRIKRMKDEIMNGVPVAKELLHLDAAEACKLRWEWGRKNLFTHQRMECGSNRIPLLEGIEEGWDGKNYCDEQMRQDRITHQEDHRIQDARDLFLQASYILQAVALERGLGE